MSSIGQASEQSGVNIETIRYYERQGVVSQPGRSASGRRIYSAAEIANLRFVKRCRDLGFSIPDIRNLLGFASQDHDKCDDVKSVSTRHIHDIQQKIKDLQRLEGALQELVGSCANGSAACPMLNALMNDVFTGPPGLKSRAKTYPFGS